MEFLLVWILSGNVLDSGLRTADIQTEGCKLVGTVEMGDAVVAAL